MNARDADIRSQDALFRWKVFKIASDIPMLTRYRDQRGMKKDQKKRY